MGRLSWHARSELKEDVLSQVARHYERARLDPIVVSGHEIAVYGWPKPGHLTALRDALAIPLGLLSLGERLWNGFPENEASIRELIAERRAFLTAVPVAADLSSTALDLVVWLLVDAPFSVASTIDDPSAKEIVGDVALGLVARDVTGLDARVDAALTAWSKEIPRQWQAERRVDPRVYEHVRALETARAACRVLGSEAGAGDVVETSIFGAFGVGVKDSCAKEAALRERLLAQLKGCGGF
jgi:hypothetical protein